MTLVVEILISGRTVKMPEPLLEILKNTGVV